MKGTIVLPSKKEAGTVIGLTALFLLLTAVCIGLRPEHVFMVGLYLLLFFAGKTTRKLAVALLPFALFGISYDWMRVFPSYEANSIEVENLYNLEKSLFGINDNGNILIPCEYFAIHNCRIADILAGIRKEDIRKALSDFKGVEHRLEKVATVRGVQFINDSK